MLNPHRVDLEDRPLTGLAEEHRVAQHSNVARATLLVVVLGDTESAFGRTWALVPSLLLILTQLLQFGALPTDFRAPIHVAAQRGVGERAGRAGVRVRRRVGIGSTRGSLDLSYLRVLCGQGAVARGRPGERGELRQTLVLTFVL